MPKKGYIKSDEHKKKISQSHIGKKVSMETRKKHSETNKKKGIKPPSNLGKKFSNTHKEKLSKAHAKEKSYLWKGGISYQPYSLDWTETLRRSIRERDNYTCQICNKPQGDRSLDIHHIDYIKENCNPNNLIALCVSCHRKTNFNRDKWIEYFGRLIWEK